MATSNLMTLDTLNKHTEARLILIFTAVLWASYFITRHLMSLTFGGWWNPVSMALLSAVGTVLMWLTARQLRNLPLAILFILGPILAYIIRITASEITNFIYIGRFAWQSENFAWGEYLVGSYWGSFLFLAWYLGYFMIVNYYRFVRESLAVAEARAQANEAQLEMLRYQINPHFLFNTLNSISALVLDRKNDNAEEMIGSLSRFLRFSLDRTPETKTPLEDEITLIKEYLAIEQIRFSEKLKVIYEIDPDTLDCLVPCLILQPALENAIKHGIAPLKTGGEINIRTAIANGKLEFCVMDNGIGIDPDKPQTGVGLRNMRDRISVQYGSEGNITIRKHQDGGTLVCLRIPVERAS